MVKKIKLLILLVLAISVASCSNDTPIENVGGVNTLNKNFTKLKKLSRDIENLSENDAEIVANLFKRNNKTTRSFDNHDIKEIIPIKNEKGETLIYAVNFTDGYIFVSASKKYYPILAIIDHGRYKTEHDPFGEDVIVHDLFRRIEQCKNDSLMNPNISIEWEKFEENPHNIPTRSNVNCPTEEEYQALYEDLLFDVTEASDGILRKLTDCQSILPPEVYRSYCGQAEGYFDNLYGGTPYSWEHTAMVAEYDNSDFEKYGAYITTLWDQYFDYSTINPGGCATVAVGQLMKFFKFPTTINWNAMSDSYMNETTRNFLIDLKIKLGISDDGVGNIYNASDLLRNYGYNCSVISHNSNSVYISLKNKRPALQRGVIPGKTYGHEWICDGYKYANDKREFYLYCLGFSDENPNELIYRRVEMTPYEMWLNEGAAYFHYVWGNSGECDGWYLDNFSNAPSNVQFTSNRLDLIINSFN